MLAFRKRLEYFAPRIKKVAYLTELEFVPIKGGEFNVIAHWKTKEDEGKYLKRFTRALVFGPTILSAHPKPVKRVCNYRDDLIREILNLRMK